MLNASAVADVSRRDRALIWASLTAITALAWTYLVHLDRQMSSSAEYDKAMAAMGMTSTWTAADLFLTFAMWAVMMAGMMAGPAAPVLLLFAGAHARREARGVPLAVLLFGLGYLTVWVGFSACAALAQGALHQAAMLSPAMAASSPRVSGAILVGAGAYQLTPFKGACLTRCRTPLGFLMTHWRDGALGALRMGLDHGASCLGCCWALMCVLFVVGVMNLVWVAALTAFVLVEKLGPAGAVVGRISGAATIAAGIFMLVRSS